MLYRSCLLPQIVVDIYEPNGIAFVDVNGTFITNELLPLVKTTVSDKKVNVKVSNNPLTLVN